MPEVEQPTVADVLDAAGRVAAAHDAADAAHRDAYAAAQPEPADMIEAYETESDAL